MKPGHTLFTRMPSLPYAIASVRDRPSTPDLAAPYCKRSIRRPHTRTPTAGSHLPHRRFHWLSFQGSTICSQSHPSDPAHRSCNSFISPQPDSFLSSIPSPQAQERTYLIFKSIPCFIICPISALSHNHTPRRLTLATRSHASTGNSCVLTRGRLVTPALFTQ